MLTIVLLAALLGVCGAGAIFAIGILSGAGASPAAAAEPLPKGPFGLAQDIPVSFGALAVENVDRIKAVTAKDLAGSTHGIQGLVSPENVQIEANTTLTNLLGEPIAYAPAQFRLVATTGGRPGPADRRLTAVGATLPPGTLQPDASVSATLTFVAPRNRRHQWIEFRDPGQRAPVLVDLGRLGPQRQSNFRFPGFDHVHGTGG